MSEDAIPVVNRTRRRLYETPREPAAGAPVPEVLPPICRESPLEMDRNSRFETDEQARARRGLAIVKRYTAWSAALDVIPLGWLGNGVLCGAVNLNMLKELCECYNLEFRRQLAATAAAAVIGAMINAGIIKILGGGLARMIPGLGGLLRIAASSAASGSVTYLTGRVFAYHFELGGTLFGLDAARTRAILLKLKEQGEPALSG